MMEELHTDSIDKGYEANYRLGHVSGRGRTLTNKKHIINTNVPVIYQSIF
jgi:hypothetical protein